MICEVGGDASRGSHRAVAPTQTGPTADALDELDMRSGVDCSISSIGVDVPTECDSAEHRRHSATTGALSLLGTPTPTTP